MTRSFGDFLSSIASILETALEQASLTSPPMRPSDIAVAIALDEDVFRRIVEQGGHTHLGRYRDFRLNLPRGEGERKIPPAIVAALHECHDRFADANVVDQKEFIGWALAKNPDARTKILQAWDVMFPSGFYMPKPGPRMPALLDLLDRMIAMDEESVSSGLSAFGTSSERLRESLINSVLNSSS